MGDLFGGGGGGKKGDDPFGLGGLSKVDPFSGGGGDKALEGIIGLFINVFIVLPFKILGGILGFLFRGMQFGQIESTGGGEARRVAEKTYRRTRNMDAARDAAEAYAKKAAVLADPPAVHGSARLATWEELKAAGIGGRAAAFEQPGAAIGLGPVHQVFGEKPGDAFAFWGSRGHLVTFAPSRAGKDAAYIVPTLLRYPASVLVMDPKGESWEATAGARHTAGSAVYRLSPLAEASHRFNPLDYVFDEASARMVAGFLAPVTSTGDGAYWEGQALNFLTGVVLWVALEGGTPEHPVLRAATIGEVHRLITRPMGDNADAKGSVLEWVEAMAGSFNPVVEAEASGFKGRPYNRRSQDLDSLKRHMAVWGNPGLQRATEASDFRLEALKRENISVYVQVPITRMKHYSSFLRMFFALATDVMTREHGEAQTPVLVFLNEFTNIGPLEHFLDDLTFVLGYGVRYWFFVQELAQLRALYPTKWESLFNSCQARVFMDIEEIPLLEYLSGKYLGNQTVAVEGFSASESYSAKQKHEDGFGWKTTTTGSGGASSSVSLVGRPVMTVDELRAMLTAKADGAPVGAYAMAVCQGERPFLVKRPFWFRRRGLASMLEAGKAALPAAETGMTGRVGI